MKKLLILIALFGSFLSIKASNTPTHNDSVRISLLTCSPGNQIYTLFGHTALRVTIPSSSYDAVYNYGIFNFNTPNFLIKFILGDTSYQLGKVPLDYFLHEYDMSNRTVWEQELNLNFEEKVKLVDLLEENYKPQNRFYHYNYFYDNCSTRPLLKIHEASDRTITLYENSPIGEENPDISYSYRSLVHKYAKDYPWSQFGMDLLLGKEADDPINITQKIFIPIELMEVTQFSKIGSNPLVKDAIILVDNRDTQTASSLFPFTPNIIFGLLLIGIIILSIYEVKKRKSVWVVDLVLFTIYGIAGCIIVFMVCFSQQPTVSTNYLLLLFQPLHLIFAPTLALKEKKGKKAWYHYANLSVLSFFILFYWLIPQFISLTILTLAGSLLIRSLTHILIQAKK